MIEGAFFAPAQIGGNLPALVAQLIVFAIALAVFSMMTPGYSNLRIVASFFIPKTVPLGSSQRIGMGAHFLWLFGTSLALFRKPSEKL